MLFTRQRREVAELAARARLDRQRVGRAKAHLAEAKRGFLANPVNLLLPFTVGALGGALALYRKPPQEGAADEDQRRRSSERVSLRSLISTVGALWSATAALRESLRAARFEPPAAPTPPESGAGMPPPPVVTGSAGRSQPRA